jgi:formylglycine-generating enzyme required for sulfatase activity
MKKMNRKILFVGLVMIIMMAGAAMGQNDCYNPTMRAAKAAYDKGNYKRAEQLYREASYCYDCTAQQKAQAKRKAEESRIKRKKIENEDRRKFRASGQNIKSDNITLKVNGVEFKMVWVEGGTFTMGCTPEQGGDCRDYEKPAHSVTVSSYYMGETEVTQALWRAVMGNNPSYFKGDNLPVELVSWEDAQEFIEKLNRLTGRTFRLPTEAEWEYAARGGSKSRGYKYSGSNSIDAVAWYYGNSGEKTHPVKGKQANELGLYDMSGNVYEWCSDWFGSYGTSSQRDPDGPGTGSYRVFRGGCWLCNAQNCRVSYQICDTPSSSGSLLGFRLVFVP